MFPKITDIFDRYLYMISMYVLPLKPLPLSKPLTAYLIKNIQANINIWKAT